MTYLFFILLAAIISITGFSLCAAIFQKKFFILDKGFIGTLIIFYFLWWLGDALAIKLDFYQYNPKLLLNIWLGGIPLEGHIAGILIVIWMRGLFNLLERKVPPAP